MPLPFPLAGLSLASQNSGIPQKWQAGGKGDQDRVLMGSGLRRVRSLVGEPLASTRQPSEGREGP